MPRKEAGYSGCSGLGSGWAWPTVNLDPNHGTTAVIVQGIQDVILVLDNGTQMPLGLGG